LTLEHIAGPQNRRGFAAEIDGRREGKSRVFLYNKRCRDRLGAAVRPVTRPAAGPLGVM